MMLSKRSSTIATLLRGEESLVSCVFSNPRMVKGMQGWRHGISIKRIWEQILLKWRRLIHIESARPYAEAWRWSYLTQKTLVTKFQHIIPICHGVSAIKWTRKLMIYNLLERWIYYWHMYIFSRYLCLNSLKWWKFRYNSTSFYLVNLLNLVQA